MSSKQNGNGKRRRREEILMYSGLTLIGATFVAWLVIRELRYEFVGAGLTLCCVGLAQGIDRKER